MMKRWHVMAVLLAALILGLLAWWWLTPPEKRAVRPSQTLRALNSRLKKLKPMPPPPPADPAPVPEPVVELSNEPLSLSIDLAYGWSAGGTLSDELVLLTLPESYWPHLDEVDWPELESVRGLQGLVDDKIEQKLRTNMPIFGDPNEAYLEANAQLDEVLDQAEAEGLLADTPIWDRPPPDDADPWALLHQAELHRAAELQAYMQSDGEGFDRIGQQQATHGLPETGWIAEQLAERHPDHPAADFARLMMLESSQWQLWAVEADPQLAVDDVILAVTEAQDPMVKETALIGMLGADPERLKGAKTDDLLEMIEEELHTLPPDLQEALIAQGLEIAIRTAPSRIDAWMDKLAELDTSREGSTIAADELQDAENDLAARGLRDPVNWSGELHARAAACHRKHALPNETRIRLQGSWSDGWSWIPGPESTPPDPAEASAEWWACFQNSTWEHTPPNPTLSLKVNYWRLEG